MANRQAGEGRPPAGREAESHAVPSAPAALQEELQRVKRVLAESQQSEQILAGLIESAMDAIISVDENQRMVLFNPAAERMFGLSATDALGQPVDIGLQGVDGYEVARRLRAQQGAGDSVCLVAVTGYGHEEARTRSADAGFDHHLVKPVCPETLLELLAEIGSARAGRSG